MKRFDQKCSTGFHRLQYVTLTKARGLSDCEKKGLLESRFCVHLLPRLTGVLDQMVLWYQCYDRFWNVKPEIAAELLRRVEQVTDMEDLRHCFPYQRLRTKAAITDFYSFYEIARS